MAPDRRGSSSSYSSRPVSTGVNNGMFPARAPPDCSTLFRRAQASPLDDNLWNSGVKMGCAKFGVKGGIQGGRKSRRRKSKKIRGGRKSRRYKK